MISDDDSSTLSVKVISN